jgi:hypothetical protein
MDNSELPGQPYIAVLWQDYWGMVDAGTLEYISRPGYGILCHNTNGLKPYFLQRATAVMTHREMVDLRLARLIEPLL